MIITLKTYLISIGIFIAVLLGGYTYHQITTHNLEKEIVQAQLDANKVGYAHQIDSLRWKLLAYIDQNKFDSLLKVNKDLVEKGSIPLIITKYVTNTQIIHDTIYSIPDPLDSSIRIARKENQWYLISSRFQTKKPYNLYLDTVSLNDSVFMLTSKTPENRISVMIKNTNPFVHIKSPETLIDPIMITSFKEIEKKSWKWVSSVNTNFTASTYKFMDIWDVNSGIVSPWNVGVNFGGTYTKPTDKVYFKFGLIYQYDF